MNMKKITVENRGKIEIKNSYITCFLGKNNIYKSSEDLYQELNVINPDKSDEIYSINGEKYLIIYPIKEKKISIVTNEGNLYKSIVHFIDDIKNIIKGLNMENPCYYAEGEYKVFQTENDYAYFLFKNELTEIKDIKEENVDFDNLEKTYNNLEIKESYLLKDINKNINLYSKIDKIGEEKYFITLPRTSLNFTLNYFYEKKKRDVIDDVIYGIFGNYASGKSFFLIYYTSRSKFPSIYLNLKILNSLFRTKGFQDLLNDELMNLFYKLKKTYNEFKNFILKFLPYNKYGFNNLIISIINEIKSEKALIVLDQYQEEIIGDKNFIKNLKKILFNKNSKIKVVISSTMNDGPIRKAYLDIILDNFTTINKNIERGNSKIDIEENEEYINGENNKTESKKNENNNEILKNDNYSNNFIPYHFMEKLVEDLYIKENIKEIKKQNDENFNEYLKLFNFLPLYYNLCRQHENDLKNFVESTKVKIEYKIKKINKKEKFNIIYFDYIRKMIDNEITVNELNSYGDYIPFKYFYIDKNDTKMILKTHFPLVKDAWNNIIMEQLVNFFDGEIKFEGNVVGSLMELNLFINIKNKIIPLEVDSFIEFDNISSFGKIVESDTKEFRNKNIFITQRNQNGPNFDFAYLEGKNQLSPKLTFIQVKKSLSNNKINRQQMYNIFEESKNNFLNSFNFIPEYDKINLIYITLFNKQIKQAFISHYNYKRNKTKRVYELGKNVNSIVYTVNQIYNFCSQNNIQLFFYEPNKHLFYIKNNNDFQLVNLDFSLENKNEFNLIFNTNYLSTEFQNNKNNCQEINLKYEKYKSGKNFLNSKRVIPFSYKINQFDMKNVFDFANRYFKNTNIINYIDLHEAHLDCEYYNLTNLQAIICFKIKGPKKEFYVDSIIYNNKLIKYEKETFKLIGAAELDRNNDFLVIISFESIDESLKKLTK